MVESKSTFPPGRVSAKGYVAYPKLINKKNRSLVNGSGLMNHIKKNSKCARLNFIPSPHIILGYCIVGWTWGVEKVVCINWSSLIDTMW